jgi:predicted secreted protein
MGFVKETLVAFLVVLFSLGTAWCGGMLEPKPEYSADSIMEAERMTMKAKVYHAPGKERREQAMGDLKQIFITRKDKNIAWIVMPEQKMYMEMPFAQAPKNEMDLSSYKVEQTPVGEETIEGIKTIKSKVVMIGPDGANFDGFLWVTPDGITMKVDAVARGKGEKTRMKMTLKNLKIGKQDPALFEIPVGYQKMSMGNPFGGRPPGGRR